MLLLAEPSEGAVRMDRLRGGLEGTGWWWDDEVLVSTGGALVVAMRSVLLMSNFPSLGSIAPVLLLEWTVGVRG